MKDFLKRFGGLMAILTLAFCLSMTYFVFAKTTVTADPNDDCQFKVTVDIAFAFLDQGSQNKADDLIKLWVQNMSKVWNGPNGYQTFGDCKCKITFEFNAQKLDAGKDCRQAPAGFHCINVVDRPTNQRGFVADAHTVPPNGNTNGFGEWTTGANGLDAAHELGHLMGLADQYHYEDKDGDGKAETYVNDNPQGQNAPQGIMAQTWGNVAALQQDINNIMSKAGKTCPGKCCCGNGTKDANASATEECDYAAEPTGCASDQMCTAECKCIGGLVYPNCGNGKVEAPEQCDPKAQPNGCKEGYKCIDCLCIYEEKTPKPSGTPAPQPQTPEPKPPETVTPPPSETPADQPGGGGAATPACGDGTCAGNENCATCSTDCSCGQDQVCSDGTCRSIMCRDDSQCADQNNCTEDFCMDPGTSRALCVYITTTVCKNGDGCCPPACSALNDADCAAVCGNRSCEAGETCASCPSDCGMCPPNCGNHVCENGETCSSCPGDCGACPPVCGNQSCEFGEDCANCPSDCGACAPVCGDGYCAAGETCAVCPGDCGACPPVCGNGVCESGEDCTSCSGDCGACLPQCTDGKDNDGDQLIDFPEDPGCSHPLDTSELNDPTCGNGVCEPQFGEDPTTCPTDCSI